MCFPSNYWIGEGKVERTVGIETLSSVLSAVQWVSPWTSICPQKDVFSKLILPLFLSSVLRFKNKRGKEVMRKREAVSLPGYIYLQRSF